MRIAPRECLPQSEQMIDPPPPVTRWTIRRKAAVVASVHSGEITLEAACGRYELSIEEFRAWESRVAPRSASSALAIPLLNSINPQDDHNLSVKTWEATSGAIDPSRTVARQHFLNFFPLPARSLAGYPFPCRLLASKPRLFRPLLARFLASD